MKRPSLDGRLFVPEQVARLRRTPDHLELCAPSVGLWRNAPQPGHLITPQSSIGDLEILGVCHRLIAPAEAMGLVIEQPGPRLARQPVEYDQLLVQLDPEAKAGRAGPSAPTPGTGPQAAGQVFRSPLSGRYYARPAPGQDPFVTVGAIVNSGQTIALLEVMKTFNRITYGGDGLPARARVLALGPTDEDDIEEGEVLLRVESVDS